MSKDATSNCLDEALYAFSQKQYHQSVLILEKLITADPSDFDALVAMSMACSRLDQLESALKFGHRAEALRPDDPMVHTNLSLFYVKLGNKEKAEHHGLQSKIASWKKGGQPTTDQDESEISMAPTKQEGYKTPSKFPDMPWKRNGD
jgi:tetratricopeptide (TPR) repeat protein